jgi:hypothetical protein
MNFVSHFIDQIKAQQGEISESLVSGYAINFESYQRLVGQHQGLEKALDIINELLNEDKNVA